MFFPIVVNIYSFPLLSGSNNPTLQIMQRFLLKPKKRRNSVKSKKEKPIPLNSALPSEENEEGESALDRLGFMIWDLVMWRDVAKSSLWFGLRCLFSLSSCFTKGLSFSLLSVISQLGLVFLAVSFMSNILHQREIVPKTQEVCLKEDDILKVIRIVLPVLNLAISKAAQLFSREPSTTLKGASGDQIEEALIANSATFKNKTFFSQKKYRLRKQKKYAPGVLAGALSSEGFT